MRRHAPAGIVFHLLGPLSEYGMLGVVCIAETVAEAQAMFGETVEILEREAALD